jgi:hypothetical protein
MANQNMDLEAVTMPPTGKVTERTQLLVAQADARQELLPTTSKLSSAPTIIAFMMGTNTMEVAA